MLVAYSIDDIDNIAMTLVYTIRRDSDTTMRAEVLQPRED